MTKDFLLRLTEEQYGAGAFPVYGRLLEEQQLTRGGPLLPMWHCTAALRRAFGGETACRGRSRRRPARVSTPHRRCRS